MDLVATPLLPEGYKVPASRNENPSKRLRRLLASKPYVFGPGVYDPLGAELVMYHGFDAQRTTDLYVNAGIAAAHIEDQVMPKRCGHIAGKALIPADEFVGKLRMMRATADDLGHKDFVIIARTDGVSATEAPESKRGIQLAIDRGLRYLDSGVPDLLWCEFPTAERGPTEQFCTEIRKRFPRARFAFNYSSSFKWQNEKSPITWDELGLLGIGFIFITLALQHAAGHGMSVLLEGLKHEKEEGYMELQRKEWAADATIPTRSHHLFTGVPYHQHVGQEYGASRLSRNIDEHLEISKVV